MTLFALVISHVPSDGKGPALRAALEEHTNASNAAGGRYSLTQRLFGSGPSFNNAMIFDGLAALDSYRAAAPTDSERQARISKINQCLAQPQTSNLVEVLVAKPPTTPPSIVHRVHFSPALGKAGELRKLLAGRMERPLPAGLLGRSLSAEVAPEAGARFMLLNQFANLASVEDFFNGFRSDPTYGAYQAELAGLVSEWPRQELYSVLVPYPPVR